MKYFVVFFSTVLTVHAQIKSVPKKLWVSLSTILQRHLSSVNIINVNKSRVQLPIQGIF
jgi:hypothetical protein